MHTRLRKLVVRAFAPRRIASYAPRIQAIIDDLLDAVMAKGSFELVADLAIPLPVTVIALILGVDPEYRHDFKRWVEEVLRYDTPVQLTYRTTVRDVEVRGVTIPAQSKVALLWGSANRDPAVFLAADRFDICRSPNNHVAFASGIHYCLGAPLARLEMRLTLETLMRRMRHLAIDTNGVCKRVDNPLLRGMQRLPLVLQPA